MDAIDPHIHVESKVVNGVARVRTLMASTFGLAGDLPSVVATGCGLRVPYAMTSPRPDHVTCLPCREHARSEHLRFADEIEGISRFPGSSVTAGQADRIAAHHRALAREFGSDRG